jgi:hypothetical protein
LRSGVHCNTADLTGGAARTPSRVVECPSLTHTSNTCSLTPSSNVSGSFATICGWKT